MKAREQLKKLRDNAVNEILGIMHKAGVDRLDTDDFSPGDSPIISYIPYDGNFTYTLDRINIQNGDKEALVFSASSCYDSADWTQDNLDAETLVGIAEWLPDYEEEIMEAVKE